MTAFAAEIAHILKGMPKFNARWLVFKKGVQIISASPGFDFLPKISAVFQEEAAALRTISFHVRREWYKRSSREWMTAFPSPIPDGPAAAAPLVAEAPAAVPDPAPAASAAEAVLAIELPSALAFAAMFEMANYSLPAVADPDSDEESVDSEIGYDYGFGIAEATGEVNAWRQLVTKTGQNLEEKENASHVTDRGPALVCVAHFLDGATHEVPGQPRRLLKRPNTATRTAPVKRPAAEKTSAPSNVEMEGDGEETREDEGEGEVEGGG